MEPISTRHEGSDQGNPDVCPASKSSRRTAAIRYNIDAFTLASRGHGIGHHPAAQVQTVPLPVALPAIGLQHIFVQSRTRKPKPESRVRVSMSPERSSRESSQSARSLPESLASDQRLPSPSF